MNSLLSRYTATYNLTVSGAYTLHISPVGRDSLPQAFPLLLRPGLLSARHTSVDAVPPQEGGSALGGGWPSLVAGEGLSVRVAARDFLGNLVDVPRTRSVSPALDHTPLYTPVFVLVHER